MVPSDVYGGPQPGRRVRAQLYQKTKLLLDHLDKLGMATTNISGFP